MYSDDPSIPIACGQLHSREQVAGYLSNSLDMQSGHFERSLLGAQMQPHWADAAPGSLRKLVDQAANLGATPYDWIDHVLFGSGITRFRSYGMLTNIRSQLRQRNPLVRTRDT